MTVGRPQSSTKRVVLAHRVTFSRTSAPLATRGSVQFGRRRKLSWEYRTLVGADAEHATARRESRSARRVGPIESAFTDQARELVVDWQRDGGYERALVAIAAADPDLAVQ